MTTAVDSNILVDILFPGAPHQRESEERLTRALEEGALVVSDVVYAEISSAFPEQADLDVFLRRMQVDLTRSDPRTLHRAGLAWRRYTQRRRDGHQCPSCGAPNRPRCEECEEPLAGRQHLVADFLIGAHALEHAGRLLTRDRGFYAACFPELTLA